MAGPTLNYEHFQIETDASGIPVEIGSTAQGVTYRAYDTRLRKTVALKIVHRELLADENVRKRFLNEARAAAALDHPNIARVIHLCPADAGEFYYAMELVEGEPLSRHLETEGPMSVADALRTLRPVADALIALGNQRLVHRDIQPANLILSADPQGAPTVKLIDFGLAKSIGTQAGLLEMVRTAELRASSVYNLSPEQIHGKSPIDCRADFYALGITLWIAITGKPPFIGSPFEVNEAHLSAALPWGEMPALAPEVRDLLAGLLAKNPEERPHDARALCALWDAALRSVQPGAPTPSRAQVDAPVRVAQPKPARPQPEPAVPAPAAEPGATRRLRRLDVLPDGCSEPSPMGYLATREAGESLFFVRPIPDELPDALTADFLQAAKTSLNDPHSTLLNVCEIQETEVVSEWRKGVNAAKLLAIRRRDVPVDVVRGWLPTVAQAVDWARDNQVRQISFTPTNWLVEFLDLDTDESPLDRAMRDPATWGRMAVWIDPLAGFDPVIMMATADPNATMLPGGSAEPLNTPAEYLAAFARAVQEILGGHHQQHGAPLATLDEAGNLLLLDAVKGRSKHTTARDWMVAFLACKQSDKSLADPRGGSTAPPPIRVSVTDRTSALRHAAATSKSPAAKRSVAGLGALWGSMSPALRWGAPFALLILAIGAFALAVASSRARDRQARAAALAEEMNSAAMPVQDANDDARRILELAEGSLLKNDDPKTAKILLDEAKAKFVPDADDGRLDARMVRLESEIEAKTVVAAPRKPAPPADPSEQIVAATRESPFVNDLGMRFLPVTITDAATGTRAVLFAETETSVRDFKRFLKPGADWRRKDFQDSDDHPAVSVAPIDAAFFANWLNNRYKLPGKWRYRLPTDHEWSAAAGIGQAEDSEALPKTKSGALKRFSWGEAWPPPARAGNFADATFQTFLSGSDRGFPVIKGYDDGYSGTAPVKTFPPNALGLYDLSGNVAEWCTAPGGYVLRGGSFATVQKSELDLSHRRFGPTDVREEMNGFRLVISDIAAAVETDTNRALSTTQPGTTSGASAASAAYIRGANTGSIPAPMTNPANTQQASQMGSQAPRVDPVTTLQNQVNSSVIQNISPGAGRP